MEVVQKFRLPSPRTLRKQHSNSLTSQTKHKVERERQKVDQMCKRRLLNESLKFNLSSKSTKKLKISTPNFMSHKKKLD